MMSGRWREWVGGRTAGMTGILVGLCLAFATASCGKKSGTPDWDTPGGEPPAAEAATEAATEGVTEVSAKPVPAVTAASASQEPERVPVAAGESHENASADGLRFMAFNVWNWLTMDRYVDNKRLSDVTKPAEEKAAAVALMARHRPDVVGLCEIGTRGDLEEIQRALKVAGVDLPHLHYSAGADSVRRLGLLSRFPITATSAAAENSFRIQGKDYSFNRGVLDATVEARGKSYRFLGVHFKSKREVEEGDQELMRQGEARLLRKHVDSILDADAGARLVVYGDFNDTRPSPSFRTVTGNYNDPKYLTAIPAKDSRGDAWTHHWKPHDIYSRIDFVTVSRALRSEVDFDRSYVVDDEDWSDASDHRAIMAIFR